MEKGAYENLNPEPLRPKLSFEFGIPQIVVMDCDKPREIDWEDGVFYVFDVTHNGEEKAIKTSAWSLLKGLKTHEPYEHKTLVITKIMEAGKQKFIVKENVEEVE